MRFTKTEHLPRHPGDTLGLSRRLPAFPVSACPRPWNSPQHLGSLALILNYSAYVAEIFRSGIGTVQPEPSG